MIRDQEFLSKNQFLTFKSKHHHQTFGIYSFSIIHFSYKSVKFMSLVRYISSCIISIIHQVSQVLSTHGDSLLLTDLLLGHHGQYLRLLLDVVRVEGDRGSCNTRISPLARDKDKWSYLRGRAVWRPGLQTVGCTSRDETSAERLLCRHHPCPLTRPDRPT